MKQPAAFFVSGLYQKKRSGGGGRGGVRGEKKREKGDGKPTGVWTVGRKDPEKNKLVV